MKKGLLNKVLVIVLVCTMLFGLSGFVDTNQLDDGNTEQIEQPTTPAGDPNTGSEGEGGNQGSSDKTDPADPSPAPTTEPEDKMITVTVDEAEGGTVSCEALPTDGKVKENTELTFKATAATEGVISSELVAVTVNGKAVDVAEDGTFKVVAAPNGEKNEMKISAEFFGIKSVSVSDKDNWAQSKTVTVDAFGEASIVLKDAADKEVAADADGKITVKENIGTEPVDYTVVVTAKNAKDEDGNAKTVETTVAISKIDNIAPTVVEFKTGEANSIGWAKIEACAKDDGSGVKRISIQYKRLFNEEWVTLSTSGKESSTDKKLAASGNWYTYYSFRVVVEDNCGNKITADQADKSAPIIKSWDITDGKMENENTVIWAREGATLSVIAQDQRKVADIWLAGIGTDDVSKTATLEPITDNGSEATAKFGINKSGEYYILAKDSDGNETGKPDDEATYSDSVNKITVKYDPDKPQITSATWESSTAADASWIEKFFHKFTGGLLFNEAFDIAFEVTDEATTANSDASGVASVEYATLEDGKKIEDIKDITSWSNENVSLEDKIAHVIISNVFTGRIVIKVTDAVGNVSYAVVNFTDAAGNSGELITNEVTFNDQERDSETDSQLAVMVTTPIYDDAGNVTGYKDYREAVADGDNTVDNWVKSVKFDIAAEKAALPSEKSNTVTDGNKTTTTTVTYAFSEDTPKLTANYDGKNEEITLAAAGDGKYTADWTLGNENVSYSGDVVFTFAYDVIKTTTVTEEVTENVTDANGNTSPKTTKNELQNNSETIPYTPDVNVKVHVQNFINAATVAASAKDSDKEDAVTTTTPLEAGGTYGWYNGINNTLKALTIKGCEGSAAPAWTYYTLTYTDVLGTETEITSIKGNKEAAVYAQNKEANTEDVVSIIKDYDKSGYYTLTVWSEDIVGNTADARSYIIKYDVDAPTITAQFTEKPVKQSGYYMKQRQITVIITDDAFTEDEAVADLFNVGFAPENGVLPVISKDWTFIQNIEDNKKIPGGRWEIVYTCGETEDSGFIGDKYKLTVECADNAGNNSSTAEDGNLTRNNSQDKTKVYYEGDDVVDFSVDQQKPVVSVKFDNNNALNDKYFAAGRTATITVTEHNFDPDRVEMTATNATSGANAAEGWKQSESNTDVWTKVVVFNPKDATCEFSITVTDKAGNVCTNNEVNYNNSVAHDEFVIDQVKPTLNITGTNATPYAGNCTPGFTGKDTNMSNKYTMTLTRTVRASRNENVSDKFLNKGSVTVTGTSINAVFNTLTKGAENDGIYKLDVTITDMAGNSTQQTSTFTVNRHGSFYVFNEPLSGLVNDMFVQKADGTYKVTEYNASPLVSDSVKIQIYCDGQLVSTLTPKTADGGIGSSGLYEYTYDLPAENFKNDGRYKIEISSVDGAQNKSDNTKLDDAVIEFVVDSVKPELVLINGLEKKIVNAEKLDITANAVDTYGIASIKVIVDGNVVKEYVTQEKYDELRESGEALDKYAVLTDMLDFTAEYTLLESSDNQHVEFIVTDMAGNVTETSSEEFAPAYEFNDTVLVSTSFWARYIHNAWAIVATVAVIAVIGAAWYFIFGKKNKKEENTAA